LKSVSFLVLLLFSISVYARQNADVQRIINQLKDKSDRQVLLSAAIEKEFERLDSTEAFNTLTQLQQAADNNAYFQVRSMLIQAALIIQHERGKPGFEQVALVTLFDKALKKAMETKDEMLVAEVCRKYSMFCDWFSMIEKAMFYSLKSLDLQERHGIEKFPDPIDFYYINSDILYKAGEYELCRNQLYKLIKLLSIHRHPSPYINIYVYNTVGLACSKLNKFDSAIYWYRKLIPHAIKINDTAWHGIAAGNIGDVYFKQKKYDSAKYYLLREYNLTMNSQAEKVSPHNSLLIVARILALQGKTDSALMLIKKAEPVIFHYNEDNRNLYAAKSDVYRARGENDSASLYFSLFQHQEDSVKRRQLQARADVTLIRLEYDKSQQVIMQMLAEKRQEKQKQYILVAGIILVLVIGTVIYRLQIQRNRLEKELLLQQKRATEETFAAAREQLDLFTAHIIEKNEMIDKLEERLHLQHQTIHDELLTQTILTDEDWNRFKLLFEKARPGFFEYLHQKAPGITPAELRLAALLQLKLDTKNIAAMQGISTDAVRKSKSRLRQRLNITLEDGLEEYIHSIPLRS
jgi:hypothetical protein